ncbi:hypothetical protein BT63DRAFT_428339 [Microthyrium microscopicum]|uniref:Nuclear localization protein n=1 Tax=Microthyrium microscopicum TaxID=703497 RepID=A0A6A6U278_9PEZI|nr:hypothetical protein BT63DRAFT_428339 [Microthyrium microscopicum]
MPRPRNRARAAATSGRPSLRSRASIATPPPPATPTPPVETPPADDDDEEMPDAPDAEQADTPQSATQEEPIATPAAEEDDEVEAEPEFVVQKVPSEKSFSPPVEVPRKRRIGRPPKYPRPERDQRDDASHEGTPQKRKRGRPPGGGRGRGRGAYVPVSQKVKIDKEGTLADVDKDEIIIPTDPKGELKVDTDGNLLGGRQYRVRTFTILNRQKRLYMLSTEPARCCGFRDSYLFFTKHLHLHKVIIDEDEKRDLIDRKVIPHSYKGRAIGVVTARSVFRVFGSKIVVGGKKVDDDYYEDASIARGEVPGELADPHDVLPPPGVEYNRNQYVAWHGASAVYHTNLPNIPIMNGKPPPGKRKVQITSANWQFEHARAASRFNAALVGKRRNNWNGVYEPHTNIVHYPKNSQPTHVKWEQLPSAGNEITQLQITNGVNGTSDLTNGHSEGITSGFSPVPDIISRNFIVTDTVFKAPPIAGASIPGPNSSLYDLNPNGLPEITDELLEDLPEECRQALVEAKKEDDEWKSNWGTEAEDGLRGHLKIGFLGFPV